MKGEAQEKVAGGKLLRIKTEFNDKLTHVEITGDFFAHPEDCIERIEEYLTDIYADFDEKDVTQQLTQFMQKHNFELIGIDPESIVRVLGESLK